ncbi:hypothetical protein F4813DRAFT_385016 [Daldinia decipiens]|uniref:uncharacterized protein n=1 Tax=Daldinia decipiens TaxID=326647 RepID=UPI0020C33298|nr:uncharacterized protein F4813DRAFT_385016 [Daldinia decipiens]KAI1662304.1 hypothetical protein F4813DRAFT_385016 [Daldinia decipiens]
MPREAPEYKSDATGQMSDIYADRSSQAIFSQANLVQPLEDSQDTNSNVITKSTLLEASSQDALPTRATEASFFIRPVLETTEEIGAAFQFQKAPPPRTISHGPVGKQRNPTPPHPPPPVINRVSHSGPSPGVSGFNSHDRPAQSLTSASDRDRIGEYYDDNKDDDTVDMIVYPREDPKNAPSSDQPPVGNSSGSSGLTSTKDLFDFPFPDNTSRPRSGGKTQASRCSPLTNVQLPKAISDTRRKAFAQMSPRSVLARTNVALSSTSNPQSTRPRSTPDRAVPSETRECSDIHKKPRSDHQLPKNIGVNETKRGSTKDLRNRRNKVQGLTRPISFEASEYDVVSAVRPCSQASNTSKPRAPPRDSYKRYTPTREQNSRNLKKFAESWNTNYLYNQRLLDRWEQKMSLLEDYIASQDLVIEQCKGTIACRDQKIDDLSTEVENLRTQKQEIQNKINISSDIRKKLEDKLKSCRIRLNDAIGEQQRLFLQCRENCQMATADIKAEEKAQKESLDKAFMTLERLRTGIKQEVAGVVKDTKGQADELSKTIKSLESELRDREVELEREKQHSQDLTEQLSQFQKLNEHSLQLVSAQNKEFLDQMKQDRKHVENTETRIQKQDEKLNMILKTLEQTNSKTVDPMAVMEKLREAHGSIAAAIVAKFQDSVVLTHNSVLEDQETLNESIGEIRLLCEGIWEKLTGLDDVAVWQERAHDSDMAINSHIQHIQDLQDELHQLYIRIGEQTGERQELERRLAIAAANEQTTNEKIKTLAEQTERLQRTIGEKEMKVLESDKNLEVVQEELRKQARVAEDRERQIQIERENHEKAIELNVQQSKQEVSRAVTERTKELTEKHQTTEKRLEEVEVARAQLVEELTKSQQEGEMRRVNLDRDIRQIRGEVLRATTSINKMTADLEETGNEQEALRGSLEGWSRGRVEVDQMKYILRRLARDQPNAILMSDQLKQLLEIQKKVSGTLAYHQAKVINAEAGASDQSRSTKSGNSSISTSNLQDNMPHAQEASQDLKRKVMVKSPVTVDDRVSPMSVEQERSTRRHTVPLRGIMKVITNDILGEAEGGENTLEANTHVPVTPQLPSKRKIARRGSKTPLTTHSIYNRPVAGSMLEVDSEQVEANQAGPSGHTNHNTIIYDLAHPDSSANEPPAKKQRISRTIQHEAQGSNIAERVKLSRSMSSYFSARRSETKEPTKGASLDSSAPSRRGGPMKRKSSGLVTYGSQNLNQELSHSQSSVISGTTEEADSQSTTASCQTIESTDNQA